jgi:hypothetical protein
LTTLKDTFPEKRMSNYGRLTVFSSFTHKSLRLLYVDSTTQVSLRKVSALTIMWIFLWLNIIFWYTVY